MWRVIYLPVWNAKNYTLLHTNGHKFSATAAVPARTQIVKFANLQHFPNPIISHWAEHTPNYVPTEPNILHARTRPRRRPSPRTKAPRLILPASRPARD